MQLLFEELAFDPAAQAIAAQRYPILIQYLEQWSSDDLRWQRAISDPSILSDQVESIQSHLSGSDMFWSSRIEQLGVALGVDKDVELIVAQRCYQRGWFDQSKAKTCIRPSLTSVVPQLTAIFQSVEGIDRRAQALVECKVCRDTTIATSVVRTFLPSNLATEITKIVLAILHGWVRYGYLGLLARSGYPIYQELCRSEDMLRKHSPELRTSATTLALRSDIWALYSTFQAVHVPLWHANMLVEPPFSVMRQRYQTKIFPKLHERLVITLADIRSCSTDAATILLKLYQEKGIPGFIALRSPNSIPDYLQAQQMDVLLEYLCTGLDQTLQTELKHHLEQIFAAATTIGFDLSLNTTLRDRPSSFRRVALKRQLRPNLQQPQRATEKQLSESYAQRVDLDSANARFRIRNVLTYGILGLIPRNLWYDLIDQRLLSWLKLIKFGHHDESFMWSEIYARAVEYCDTYDIPHYASPLLQSLFNSIPKRRHWHGGKGLVTLNVHQRIPLSVTKRPRLNAEWLIFPIPLNLAIAAHSDQSYLTLVADSETQLPLGGWLSPQKPTQQEVGLALYQAIWHIGAVDFPIRGIPKTIKFPSTLIGSEWADLQRAAHFLMTGLEDVPNWSLRGKRHLQEFITALRAWATQKQADLSEPFLAPVAAFRELMGWIEDHSFPFHRQNPAPASLRSTGHALPGFDTPAAGWLLPVVGSATVHRRHIVIDQQSYPVPPSIVDGTIVNYRRLPVFFLHDQAFQTTPCVFIETVTPEGLCVHCLTIET
ncbi:MAG: hypothetical protein H0T53_17420 [Herpetosiphonaceae bacterium]|nr:hypothetical protein [Herpetosiphonaceae bacterium]